MAKVQVPIEKVIEVLKGGPLTTGWSRCRVHSLEKRNTLLWCYKCLRMGHMVKECGNANLRRPCYRCSKAGHVVSVCKKPLSCQVCRTVEGQPSDHILGGHGCSSNVS